MAVDMCVVDVIYLEFSEGFGTVSRDILIKQLRKQRLKYYNTAT